MCKPESRSTAVRKFTWAEIEGSVGKTLSMTSVSKGGPAYTVIHGKVYDLSGDFLAWHPGSAVALSQLGKDASGAFEVFHSSAAYEVLGNYYVGDLAEGEVRKPNAFAEDVQELRAALDKMNIYESSLLYYSLKVLSNIAMMTASLAILFRYGNSPFAVILSGVIMAVFFQQSGWLAHDFLHHQVFKNRTLNTLSGYIIGNLWQGFSVTWWKVKHSTHHSTPNIHTEDPDISTMPILAWSEHALELFNDIPDDKLAHFMIENQNVLFFPILAFARLSWCWGSIKTVLPVAAKQLMIPDRALLIERITLALHWVWYLGAAFGATGSIGLALLWITVSQTVCGLLLAFVFVLNHVSDWICNVLGLLMFMGRFSKNGMPIFTVEESKDYGFYELQVVTGRDVKPTWFSDWFTGGLNYQIEHHMFPNIPRHNFHKVAPLVESLCRKHGVVYHRTGMLSGMSEVIGRLANVAQVARKKAAEKK
ncbi:fatty acid desaturase-domain-containing protein [Cladochytrium replicatum]|nr:fatty acid desaturase-domain-containing protein [Cladochytrium replicatum]